MSHLGIGPNGSNIVFNLGSMLSGIVMVFFFLNLSVFLIKKEVPRILVKLSFTAGFLSSIGIFMVGVFPGDGSGVIHNFWASFFFIGGLTYCILYGISEWKAKGISKLQALSGFITAFPFLVFLYFTNIKFFNHELALQISHFSEWILFTFLMCWIIGHEFSMIKDRRLT